MSAICIQSPNLSMIPGENRCLHQEKLIRQPSTPPSAGRYDRIGPLLCPRGPRSGTSGAVCHVSNRTTTRDLKEQPMILLPWDRRTCEDRPYEKIHDTEGETP